MTPTAGLGFKPEHFKTALASPAVGLWFEVHPENYMAAGGPRPAMLEALRRERPLSLHGVGLSLAADADPDADHLARLKAMVDRYQPQLVSEHLAWSAWRGAYHPDLLPFPRTRAALERIVRNVDIVQTALRRPILVENPSLYIPLEGHELSETEFLAELARRTGCGLLMDVNNVHVSANNLGFDPRAYLDAIPAAAVGEIHLAGHSADPNLGEALLIDTHGAPIAEAVWALYERLIGRIGPRPTLIERDDDIPAFEVLLAERDRAQAVLHACEALSREPAHV
ncbi:DUF692 domain-containing protein [Phenylobacterium sp.]|uniref:MNIO family bufferin maturase n=1 Tax=Phenylobacterium sp. TaxID=1871053 RepID=UPI0035B34130